MNVLIVSRGIPYEGHPLHGVFEFDQAKALNANGVDVTLFAIDLRSIRHKRKYGISYINMDGINCYTINVPVGAVPINILGSIGKKAFSTLYKKVYKNKKPDIIHAHFVEQGYYAKDIAKIHDIPMVVTEHSSRMQANHIRKDLFKIAKKTYSSVDKVIAVGNGLAKTLNNVFHIDSFVIPNIVDTSLFQIKKKCNEETFSIISVGRLISLKKMDVLIDVFYEFSKKNSKVKLDIYGDGPMKIELQMKIDSYHLEDVISLHGAVQREEIAEALSESDVFILLSETETFGVAFIEALSVGIPVIGMKCGGPEEFVNDKNGYLLDKESSIVDISNKLQDIYDNYNKYEANNIRREIKERYNPDVVAEKLMKLYDELKRKS